MRRDVYEALVKVGTDMNNCQNEVQILKRAINEFN